MAERTSMASSASEEDEFYTPYEGGHWEWDNDQLVYIRAIDDTSPASHLELQPTPPATTDFTEFWTFQRHLNVLDQLRFIKKYQRKYNEHDVVTLQDVKDLVLFLAPADMVNVMLVNAVHTVTFERFLRALILYCEYYLEVLNMMECRTKERETMIPTKNSDVIEATYRENLSDLRLLVGKEYCKMILGTSDMKNFYHMGRSKSVHLTDRDRKFFEELTQFCSELVWIALGRKSFPELNVEINRLFRSKNFNMAERKRKLRKMTGREQRTVQGRCVVASRKWNAHSPAFDEAVCNRNADYRMLGLGSIQYDDLDDRLKYLEQILTAPESEFPELNLSLGIIGTPWRRYDTLLKEIPLLRENPGKTSSSLRRSFSFKLLASRKSTMSLKTKKSSIGSNVFKINLPPKTIPGPLPDVFPSKSRTPVAVNEDQHKKWLSFAKKAKIRKYSRVC